MSESIIQVELAAVNKQPVLLGLKPQAVGPLLSAPPKSLGCSVSHAPIFSPCLQGQLGRKRRSFCPVLVARTQSPGLSELQGTWEVRLFCIPWTTALGICMHALTFFPSQHCRTGLAPRDALSCALLLPPPPSAIAAILIVYYTQICSHF